MTTSPELERALLAEVASKADLVWVQVADQPARGMWHVWHGGAVLLVTGGIEQPDPGLVDGESAILILRSKDKQTRALRTASRVVQIQPSSPEWAAAAAALHPQRLNPPDGEGQPDRWRTESVIWQLTPTDDFDETPGAMSSESHRAEPMVTPATTSAHRPFHAGRATKRRR